MRLVLGLTLLLAACGCSATPTPDPAAGTPEAVEYLGLGTLPGTTADLSGLTGELPDGTPHNRLGGLGSAIAYTGAGNAYVLVADRGPKDGAVPFACRMHTLDIAVTPGRTPAVTLTLTATHLLTEASGKPFVGAAKSKHRLDPEGARVGPNGTVFIADEYGPTVAEFTATGKLLRTLPVPEKFRPERPGEQPEDELPPHNRRGRQPNRGFEGLAITPDGKTLLAALQSPLLQDHPTDSQNRRVGVNVRFLEIPIDGGATREFVYTLDKPGHGVNEVLAYGEGEFLVLERDALGGPLAKFKRVFRVSVKGATDVSGVESLPSTGLPQGMRALTKVPFLNILDRRHGIRAADIAEKFEGLAFGPDLPDGRKLLLITADNDFLPEQPLRVYAFAVGVKK